MNQQKKTVISPLRMVFSSLPPLRMVFSPLPPTQHTHRCMAGKWKLLFRRLVLQRR
jgi:hypothetical protein